MTRGYLLIRLSVDIYSSDWAWIFINCSGWHSGLGSRIPGITQKIRLWLNTSGVTARLFAQNFDARLAGIVIGTDGPPFENKTGGPQIHENRLNTQDTCQQIQDVFFLRVPNRRRQLPPVAQLGGERARHSHILQVYRHSRSIQNPKYKSRYPGYKSRHPNPPSPTHT